MHGSLAVVSCQTTHGLIYIIVMYMCIMRTALYRKDLITVVFRYLYNWILWEGSDRGIITLGGCQLR